MIDFPFERLRTPDTIRDPLNCEVKPCGHKLDGNLGPFKTATCDLETRTKYKIFIPTYGSISKMAESKSLIPSEIIEKRIFLLRGQKVMLSSDLAELYQVEPRALI
jgi:hypothetical protein